MIEKYKISAKEIQDAQVEGNLADRPSQKTLYGGKTLTPNQIKAAYDRLPKLVAKKFNDFIKSIPGVTGDELDDDSLAAMILTGIREGHTLKDLFEDLKDGKFSEGSGAGVVGAVLEKILDDTPHLIVFTIDGTTYLADNGMSWNEWIASSYNTGGLYISSTAVMVAEAAPLLLNGKNVTGSDKVQANASYMSQFHSNIYYFVTNYLTNCSNSNPAAETLKGGTYSAILYADSGYTLKSVLITIGGKPVTANVYNPSTGEIIITNVTGDIIITAVAEKGASVDPGTPESIAFTIDGVSYEAYTGMSWGEWIDSSYNTIRLETSGTAVMVDDNEPLLLNGVIVNIENLIQDGAAYKRAGESVNPGLPDTITFTIDGASYEAYRGMSWGEWVESSYNTIRLSTSGTAVMVGDNEPLLLNGVIINIENKIQANAAYKSQGASVDPGLPDRITFTIDGTSHEAYSGMSWGEWVDSSYNTIRLSTSGTAVMVDDNEPLLLNGVIVNIENLIQDGAAYKRAGESVNPGLPDTITFTIDGASYEAYRGMSWGEWVESSYNTIQLTTSGTAVMVDENTPLLLNGVIVNIENKIQANAAYKSQGASVEPGTPDTITFTIDGTSYEAYSGQSWGEWIESSYNTIRLTTSGTAVMVGENTPLLLNGVIVGISNVIQANGEYKRQTSGNDPGVTESISFTIDGQSYATYKGRRWGDWADSDENTSECYPYGEYIMVADNTLLLLNGVGVKTNDFIIAGADYTRQDSITFTIDHAEYKAISGMTWREWVNRHYNRDGFWIDESTSCVRPNGNATSICVHTSQGNIEIKADNEITASGSYTVSTC